MILSFRDFLNESKLNESRRFIVKDPNTNIEYYAKVPDTKNYEIIRLENNYEVINRWITELGNSVNLNGRRLKMMSDRNVLATTILYRIIKGGDISDAEYEFLTSVALDNLKAFGLVIIASPIIPGDFITLPIIFKIANHYGIDLFPEVWKLLKDEELEIYPLPSYIKKVKKVKDLEVLIN